MPPTSASGTTRTIGTRHVGVHGGLVNKHKMGRIKQPLLAYPAPTGARHVRPVLLAGVQGFMGWPAPHLPAEAMVALAGVFQGGEDDKSDDRGSGNRPW